MKYQVSGRLIMDNNGFIIINDLHNNTTTGLALSDILNKCYMDENIIHISIKSKNRKFENSGILFRDKIYKDTYGYYIYSLEDYKNDNYDCSSGKCIEEFLLDCVGHDVRLEMDVESGVGR